MGEKEIEEMSVFKSFLREQMEHQKKIKEALEKGDIEEAKKLIDQMIERTQKGIED